MADSRAPGTREEAAALLRGLCPASRPLLEELTGWWPDPDVFALINQIVQVLLRETFNLTANLSTQERPEGWVRLPTDPEGVATMHQLYLVLEIWAQALDDGIRDAVAMEFAEGWGGWTSDISRSGPIGPHLLSLIDNFER